MGYLQKYAPKTGLEIRNNMTPNGLRQRKPVRFRTDSYSLVRFRTNSYVLVRFGTLSYAAVHFSPQITRITRPPTYRRWAGIGARPDSLSW